MSEMLGSGTPRYGSGLSMFQFCLFEVIGKSLNGGGIHDISTFSRQNFI